MEVDTWVVDWRVSTSKKTRGFGFGSGIVWLGAQDLHALGFVEALVFFQFVLLKLWGHGESTKCKEMQAVLNCGRAFITRTVAEFFCTWSRFL